MRQKLSYLFSPQQLLLLLVICGFALYGLWSFWAQRSDAAEMTMSASSQEVALPVIMYHSVLEDAARAGKYVVTTETLREDLSYLAQRGYTSVTIADLIAYVSGQGDLPEKPVMITFDDGFLNSAVLALPLLQEYSFRAVLSVVGDYTDNASVTDDRDARYSYLTWDDLRQLAEEGTFEIQNHSYSMHTLGPRQGCAQMPGESADAYESALRQDLRSMQDRLAELAGVTATAFVPPFGLKSEHTTDIAVSMGFSAILTCSETVTHLTRDPECLYSIGRFNRPSGISTSEFMKKLGIS